MTTIINTTSNTCNSAAANNYSGKTEAGAASIARFYDITQLNYIQRAFGKIIHYKNQARAAARGSARAESGLGLAAKERGLACHCASCLLHKKSQSAMEFLMTYGWAILVVLAAIGALAYFGVLSPAKFLPESCTLPSTSGIACLDFTLYPDSARLFMMNGGGRDLVISNMSVGDCSAVFTQSFADGTSHLFNLTGCSFGSSGQKVKLPLTLSYTDTVSGFTKEASGSITSSLS